jgi:hypothetical protein
LLKRSEGPELFLFRRGAAIVEDDLYTPAIMGGLRLPMSILIEVKIDDLRVAIIPERLPGLRGRELARADFVLPDFTLIIARCGTP